MTPSLQPDRATARQVEYRQIVRTIRRAMSKGASRLSATMWEWDVAGNCQSPLIREMWSRPSASDQALAARKKRRQAWVAEEAAKTLVEDWEWTPPPIEPKGFPRFVKGGPGQRHLLQLRMHVKCRQCEKCRAMKRSEWFWRASDEIARSSRTWFVTLTFNDFTQFKALALARRKATAKSVTWEQLSPDKQFRLHAAAAYQEYVQNYWKRLRKTGSTFRLLCVSESGDEKGRLHFHCFVHETKESAPLTEKTLRTQWRGHGCGFAEAKLVAEQHGAARYVTKYISKGTEDRVRCSGRYGRRSVAIVKRETSLPPKGKTPTHNDNPLPSLASKERESKCGEIVELKGD